MLPTRAEAHWTYTEIHATAKAAGNGALKKAMRDLALKDVFYLGVFVCGRKDMDRDWIYDRCKEVQENPNEHLDVWAREHYKSTIITFLLTVQDILRNAEIAIGIFSFKAPIAKSFLRQIKLELETNDTLKWLFDEVLWADPLKDCRKKGIPWSLDDGITVKRTSNRKEATVTAHGLIEGLPTGPHYDIRIYDDVITKEMVTNPEMIEKATLAWEMSINLGAEGGTSRVIGTFYHLNDTYRVMMDRKAYTPRIHPGTVDGTATGEPVLMSEAWIDERRRNMGEYVFSSQILCDPKQEGAIGFNLEWVQYWGRNQWFNMNIIMICDPAGEKKKHSDFTAIWVIGLGSDQNIYILDILRDRLSLTERGNRMFSFHRQYHPQSTYYEKYGKDSDIDYFNDRMDQENYHFHITAVGGPTPKNDRIRALVPWFEKGRIYLPHTLIREDYQGKQVDLVQYFLHHEYDPFPFGAYDDLFDALARLADEKVILAWPQEQYFGDTVLPPKDKQVEGDPWTFAG